MSKGSLVTDEPLALDNNNNSNPSNGSILVEVPPADLTHICCLESPLMVCVVVGDRRFLRRGRDQLAYPVSRGLPGKEKVTQFGCW
jgi:hypothetical protein